MCGVSGLALPKEAKSPKGYALRKNECWTLHPPERSSDGPKEDTIVKTLDLKLQNQKRLRARDLVIQSSKSFCTMFSLPHLKTSAQANPQICNLQHEGDWT